MLCDECPQDSTCTASDPSFRAFREARGDAQIARRPERAASRTQTSANTSWTRTRATRATRDAPAREALADAPDETRKRQRRARRPPPPPTTTISAWWRRNVRVCPRASAFVARRSRHTRLTTIPIMRRTAARPGGRRRRRATRGTPSAVRFREVDSDSSDEAADAIVCARCGEGDDASKMILCDACDSGTHIYCLRPKLSQVPRGRWFCPTCEAQTEAARVARAAIENAARRMVGDRKIDAILASRRRAGAPPGPGGADARLNFCASLKISRTGNASGFRCGRCARRPRGNSADIGNVPARHFRTRRCARTFPRSISAPSASSPSSPARCSSSGTASGTTRPPGSPKRTRPRRPSRRRPSRRSEETRKNGRRAKTRGRRGKRRRRERRRRRREVPRTPPPPGAPSSRGWGNRTTRATRWTRRRCTPRARESRRVTETPISRRSWRRSWRRFSRAPRGIRRLRNPRPSREDAARRALWRLKISNICSSARGPDTAWTPPRTGEKPRRRRSPRENRRGARGGTARRRFEHRRRLGSAPARARPARVSAPGRAVDAR